MSPQKIITVSGTHQLGSFGWRHRLTWRQLSTLWRIPVSHHLSDSSLTPPGAIACSIAVAHGEGDGHLIQHWHRRESPVIIFLNRAVLRLDGAKGLAVEFTDHHRPENRLHHVFQVEHSHRLVEGLPKRVTIYGECPTVTPLEIDGDIQVLVSLDGIPIIAVNKRSLLIGADPWQFGVPSVPVIYKILSNWLIHEVGYKHSMLKPFAAIRFDDLPTTAEELKTNPPCRDLDRKRFRVIRRLRRFGYRTGAKFTLMYSSHFPGPNGGFRPISSVVPRSIREMQLGVSQGVFEVGSHGMVHLRKGETNQSNMGAEFEDLDEHETATHLETSDGEILRLFGGRPQSFVAPNWVYRPGVTKRIAAERYDIILDSSQHVENGECDVFLAPGQEGGYLNVTETFRPGSRMLTYSRPEFWRCYAGAGLPIHYMQHMDTNWHILLSFLKAKTVRVNDRSPHLPRRLLELAEDPRRPLYIRALCTLLLTIISCRFEPASWKFVWIALSRNSIYSFVRMIKSAGYECVTLTELRRRVMDL